MKNLVAALVIVGFTAFSFAANASIPVAKPGTTVCAKDSSKCKKDCKEKCCKGGKKSCDKKK